MRIRPTTVRVTAAKRAAARPVLVALVVVALVATALDASAATFTVNDAADTSDGVCGAAVGECTLRDAIGAAVAAPGRDTIRFDPTVFPRHDVNPIFVSTPLPLIFDPAGTVVDGAGAGAVLAGDVGVNEGLVFASPPGVTLAKVTVANLVVFGFSDVAVYVCGGSPPECPGDVSGALVQNVAVSAAAGDGIRIEGRTVSKSRIVDSMATNVTGCGIQVLGETSIVGARVERSSVLFAGSCGGILLRSLGRIVGPTVVDSLAARGAGVGIGIDAEDVEKASLANLVATDNDGVGVQIHASRDNGKAKVTNVVASGNGSTGMEVSGDVTNAGHALKNVVADGNDVHGVALFGITSGPKISGVATVANGDAGLGLFAPVTGAKVSRVTSVANNDGVFFLVGTHNTAQGVLAAVNEDAGILVVQGGSGNTIKKSAAPANQASGIAIALGDTANVVQQSTALGNDTDLFDGNLDCDGNQWVRNVFRTASQPCIH